MSHRCPKDLEATRPPSASPGRTGRITEPAEQGRPVRPMREHGLSEDELARALSGRPLDLDYITEGIE